MNRYTATRSKNNNQDASFKMAVTFNEDKVINITVNGMGLATTTACGSSISVGDTSDVVKKICGEPAFINKSDQKSTAKSNEETEFKYGTSTLLFLNGKLQEMK